MSICAVRFLGSHWSIEQRRVSRSRLTFRPCHLPAHVQYAPRCQHGADRPSARLLSALLIVAAPSALATHRASSRSITSQREERMGTYSAHAATPPSPLNCCSRCGQACHGSPENPGAVALVATFTGLFICSETLWTSCESGKPSGCNTVTHTLSLHLIHILHTSLLSWQCCMAVSVYDRRLEHGLAVSLRSAMCIGPALEDTGVDQLCAMQRR